ncbi:hypothetical protein BUALT_Bualt10G0129000 [Buddleja alternifolia]|uniref:PGG domain-containing protein n=1 Tax=Buddleja alternifolia TaxID=168488 RepID=A0AAV6X5J7_9LAMI|nr:hypothetical protein BUALT_Bualt10G0129000 [Buddleja alternifolia]
MEGSLEKRLYYAAAWRENRLYDAAAEGNTESLHELLEQDEFLLDRVSFTSPNKSTPLHVAATKGHLAFVQQILIRNRRLAQQLDSQQSSPLHIASAEGHSKIVKILLSAAPNMCLSRDYQGRNPLHLAVMRDHVEILKALIKVAPSAAREKAGRDQTVLHLCVKHGQLEALKILAPKLNDLINAKNADASAALKIEYAICQWLQIIKYLKRSKIDFDARNCNGQTAKDILEDLPKNDNIRNISKLRHCKSKTQTQREEWLTKKGDAIMVVAVLIATVAYQAGVSPAGGIWQENLTQYSHVRAGEAVMAYTHPEAYENFMRSNTIGFVSSVTTILFLMSGLPFRRRLFMWILIIIMWLTVTSLTVSYAISIVVVTPKSIEKSMPGTVLKIGLGVWSAVMGIVLVGSKVKRLKKWLNEKGIRISKWLPGGVRNRDEVMNSSNASNGIV